MLEILARVVEEPLLAAVKDSVAIGPGVDETTDVSVKRQLDLHVRYYYRTRFQQAHILMKLSWFT